MNRIDRTIPLKEILRPTFIADESATLFIALAVITGLTAYICYTATGKGPLFDALAINSGGLTGLSAFIYGADQMRTALMLRRLRKKGEPEDTYLDAACRLNDLRAIKWLVERGASPNYNRKPATNWFTPLMLAVRNNNLKAAHYLVEQGANVNEQAPHTQRTALHEAVLEENLSMVRFLLENGAKPDLQDNRQRTPLHLAIWRDNAQIIHLLSKYNADQTLKDETRKTAYQIACENNLYALYILRPFTTTQTTS